MGANYTSEETEAILTRAASKRSDQTVSHERLLAMAEELGIPPEDVEAVIEEVRETERDKALRREFIAERRATFWPHLIPYLLVSLFLITVNLLSRSHHIWAIYPILGWGIGIGSHALAVLPTSGVGFEREFQQWKVHQERKVQRNAKRAAKKTQTVAERTANVESAPPLRPTLVRTEETVQMLQQRSGQ